MDINWKALTTEYDTTFACKEWPSKCPFSVNGAVQMVTDDRGSTHVNFRATLHSDKDIGVYKKNHVNYLGFSYGWSMKEETPNSRIASYGCFW